MIEPYSNKGEILLTEEEPVPEEYKEHRTTNQNNISQSMKEDLKLNPIISSSPQTNNILEMNQQKNQTINNLNSNQIIFANQTFTDPKKSSKKVIEENNENILNEKTVPNNNNFNLNTNNHSISISRVSKAKTTLPNYDNSKYENYNIEKMRYNLVKEYSYLHIDKNENFLNRMQFDIYKRQIKEDRINKLVEQNKVKMDEDERIKAFNRLIIDANRRLEAQENLENMKNKLEEDITSGTQKKYSDEEWKEIYNKRFKKYVDNINKKKEEKIKLKNMKKINDENQEINLCPTRKASQKHIEQAAQRMYDEAKKRRIKMDEKIRRINNFNYEDDDASKYVKNIKSEAYSFADDEEDSNKMNSLEGGLSYNTYYIGCNNYNNKKQGQMKKTKGMAVSEFNNKRFDKRHKAGKSCSNINNNYIQKDNITDFLVNNYGYKKNEYNLEEERNKLIQMANNKNLKHNTNNFKYNFDKTSPTSGVSNLVDQFFLRQLKNNEM